MLERSLLLALAKDSLERSIKHNKATLKMASDNKYGNETIDEINNAIIELGSFLGEVNKEIFEGGNY